MLQNLEILARDARSWPFEQARNLLAHVLKKRLSDAERDAARLLIDAGKADEALATFEALRKHSQCWSCLASTHCGLQQDICSF